MQSKWRKWNSSALFRLQIHHSAAQRRSDSMCNLWEINEFLHVDISFGSHVYHEQFRCSNFIILIVGHAVQVMKMNQKSNVLSANTLICSSKAYKQPVQLVGDKRIFTRRYFILTTWMCWTISLFKLPRYYRRTCSPFDTNGPQVHYFFCK